MVEQCKVIAELGCTHIGNMGRAKHLIELAAFAKADYVKFQKRNPEESVPNELKNKPHPNPAFSYGKTYLEHRKNIELDIEQHAELKKHCEALKIGYSTSVWDMTSAKEVIQLNPDFIKIPSACCCHFEMLDYLVENFDGGIHISTGMATHNEKQSLMNKFHILNDRVVLYHCVSEYPTPFERLYLNEILRLKESFSGAIGFSNHGYGIAADIAAYTLGATWIERHTIDDRVFRHTDASASLEFDGLRKLCRDLKAVQNALQYKTVDLTEGEQIQRKKLRVLPNGD